MGNNNTHCCICTDADPCLVSGSYTPCGVDRIVWEHCSGTVYSCSGANGCPDSGCDEDATYTIAGSAKVYQNWSCGGSPCYDSSCDVSVGAWTFTYTDDECASEYTSGADSTYNGFLGSCQIAVGDPCDIFDNCGDCFYSHYSPATHGYIRVTEVITSSEVADLNWYSAFVLSADLRLYQPSGVSGCGGYRSGDDSLWKVTAYQARSLASIRLRWYFRDCCYQEETMSIVGDSSDGGDSLSGYTTCINSRTDETGVFASSGLSHIFTLLRLEDYGVEYDITSSDVQVYNQRCGKYRQNCSITVDGYQLFVDEDDGAPTGCTGHNFDCPHCDGDDTFTSECYTDYAQIITTTDAENWDACAGGTTFINWQCEDKGSCSGGECDCQMEDVTVTVTK